MVSIDSQHATASKKSKMLEWYEVGLFVSIQLQKMLWVIMCNVISKIMCIYVKFFGYCCNTYNINISDSECCLIIMINLIQSSLTTSQTTATEACADCKRTNANTGA
jgi:hypothetical protein